MRTRREFLHTLGAGAATTAVAGCGSSAKRAGQKPNVIIFITDDQGYGDLRCHGNDKIHTPNLDRLHAESTRLTDFHVDPTCSPTRSALMTGLYSHRTGVWHTILGRNHLHRDEMTMAEVFKNSGYRTGIFGKWHLGGSYPYRPIDRGFDTWVGHGDGGTGTTSDYWGNDKMDDTYYRDGRWEKFQGFCTDIYFQEAMDFIGRQSDAPFFVYLPTNVIHSPWNVPHDWMEPYWDMDLPEEIVRCYATMSRADHNLGRLRQFLDQSGLANDIVLIFLTDNGGTVGTQVFNAGMRGRKGSLYDGGHRVPCFIHWRGGGIAKSRDIRRITAHVDLLPTLIDLCDLQAPREVEFDGTSLAPLLHGGIAESEWPDRTLLVESIREPYTKKWKATVMNDRWRLVRGSELYDMLVDPGQQKDVSSEHQDVVAKLTKFYEEQYPKLCRHDDDFARPIAGASRQEEIWLNSADWFSETGSCPWAQGHVRDGVAWNGFWELEIAAAGAYDFELRRWPKEADFPITAPAPALQEPKMRVDDKGIYSFQEGKALPITRARLQVGEQTAEQQVSKSDQAVRFRMKLSKGNTRVQTWFTNDEGLSLGAYYVYIKKVRWRPCLSHIPTTGLSDSISFMLVTIMLRNRPRGSRESIRSRISSLLKEPRINKGFPAL